MKFVTSLLVVNLTAIIATFFVGYIIFHKGYVPGTGWLIFIAIISGGSVKTSYEKKGKSE